MGTGVLRQSASPGDERLRRVELSTWAAPGASEHQRPERQNDERPDQRADHTAPVEDGGVANAKANGEGDWEQMQVARGWELIFSRPRNAGDNPVLKHARYTGGDSS